MEKQTIAQAVESQTLTEGTMTTQNALCLWYGVEPEGAEAVKELLSANGSQEKKKEADLALIF